ncbi:hypothetical protein D3C79_866790 [compost metagenome]
MLEKTRFQYGLQHCQAGGAHQCIAVVTALQLASFGTTGTATGQQGCQWHTATQALAQRDDVGAYTVGLLGKQGAATTNTGLHFIENQQDAQLTAQLLNTFEVGSSRWNHSGLTLDRLEHDRHRARIDGGVQRFQVVERYLAETWQPRLTAVAW